MPYDGLRPALEREGAVIDLMNNTRQRNVKNSSMEKAVAISPYGHLLIGTNMRIYKI